MEAAALSEYLRNGQDVVLWCRRGILLTSFVAIIAMMVVGAYQMGLLAHVPEPALPHLDADRVDAAPAAYQRMFLPAPDAFLGLVSYSVTAFLAAAGGPARVNELWWLPVVLAGKLLLDAGQAGRLTWEQWSVHQAFCSWCLLAAAATFVALPLAIPETYLSVKRLVSG